MQIQRFNTGPRMSKAVLCNGMVFLAGIVAEAACASIAEETAQILGMIDALRHYDEMNTVWDAWLPPGEAPARACVEAKLARPHARVEIMVIAAQNPTPP